MSEETLEKKVILDTDYLNRLHRFEDNKSSQEYFNRLSHVVVSLINICEEQLSQGQRQSIDEITVLKYLKKLSKSIKCLQTKYWYNVSDYSQQSSILYIDSENSGYPVKKEFRELLNDVKRADEILSTLPSEEELKSSQLEYLLTHKKINRDIQFDLQASLYFRMLKDNDLFLPDHEPTFVEVNDSKGGNSRFIAHWASFDSSQNIPAIYIMLFEYSGKKKFVDSDIYEQFKGALIENTMSSLKLLTICNGLDSRFQNIHPKRMKRVTVGPFYSKGLTENNRNIDRALEYVEQNLPNDNWLFAYSVESLLSKRTMKTDSGFFKSSQQKEVYLIDSTHPETGVAQCSDLERSIIIPYSAYQQLADQKNNSLNDVQKYIINTSGKVIYL